MKYEMYKAQFNDADEHFFLGDVHSIQSDSVPTVTLATASFPCNDLSLADPAAVCVAGNRQPSGVL
jgi:DNA (cytosine-5)-methyltransferase 1